MISDFKIFKHDIIKASLFILLRTCGDLHFGYVLKLKDILFKYKIILLAGEQQQQQQQTKLPDSPVLLEPRQRSYTDSEGFFDDVSAHSFYSRGLAHINMVSCLRILKLFLIF